MESGPAFLNAAINELLLSNWRYEFTGIGFGSVYCAKLKGLDSWH
jgi:hypothetical protein